MNFKNLDYSNIDNRLDLDNHISTIVKNFPSNDTDFLFYIRGNTINEDMCFLSSSNYKNFFSALYTIIKDDKIMFEEFEEMIKEIKKYRNNINN